MFHIKLFEKKEKNELGFSLAEIVIVLGILTFGLIGITSLIFQNMQVENTTKNYLMASMIAQEGIELVRNIRDENWVIFANWLDDIPNGDFIVDYRGRSSVDSSPNSIHHEDAKLYIDGSGFYSHVVTIRGTGFSRLITVQVFPDYILVQSDVMWSGRFGERHFTIETTLFNWRGI